MSKQEEIREAIDTYADNGCLFPDRWCNAWGGNYCSSDIEDYKCLMENLTEIGVVLKGESLGASHPHLADYYTVESLVEEKDES